jgi:hypothetical protein
MEKVWPSSLNARRIADTGIGVEQEIIDYSTAEFRYQGQDPRKDGRAREGRELPPFPPGHQESKRNAMDTS